MDGASAIAGLISLAALTLSLLSKTYDIVSELRDIPTRFQQELEWLTRLRAILMSVNDTCNAINQLNARVNTRLFREILYKCYNSMQALDDQIMAHFDGLQPQGLKSKIKLAIAVFKSEKFQKSKHNINQCMNDLSLAHQEVSSELSIEHYYWTRHGYGVNVRTHGSVQQLHQKFDALATYLLEAQESDKKCQVCLAADQKIPDSLRIQVASEPLHNVLGRNDDDSDIGFLIDVCASMHTDLDRPRKSDISRLMTSWSIPREFQAERLYNMKLLLNTGARLDASCPALLKSWMYCPYSLEEAFAIYQTCGEQSGPQALKEYLNGEYILELFRNILYTFDHLREFPRWIMEIVKVALEFDLELGIDLKNGVRFFDGPLKFSIWFNQSYNTECPLQNFWYDGLEPDLPFTYFKAWFDALLLVDRERQRKYPQQCISELERYIEPTLQAFLGGHVSPWFCALKDADIDVHAVATCVLTLADGREDAAIRKSLGRYFNRSMNPWAQTWRYPAYIQHILERQDLKEILTQVFVEYRKFADQGLEIEYFSPQDATPD